MNDTEWEFYWEIMQQHTSPVIKEPYNELDELLDPLEDFI